MDECERVSELLLDYMNRRLSGNENIAAAKHLAECRRCRNELAVLLRIRNLAHEGISPIPQDIADTAFDKIPDTKGTLAAALNLRQYFKAFDYLHDAMSVVNHVMKLAQQAM
ncbi:MAG TPA: zf-HC2 domain-containing protein [Clostridiales bacterium]|nr:zf-HC2 domain-containing protein [Clostridiales bacterium]HOL92264.1 zf-HC2 domain-containing protein [Clostridiales bacterium]HPP35675.1 zf-HC2 domain-containing protein [Clostridiales bacterium]